MNRKHIKIKINNKLYYITDYTIIYILIQKIELKILNEYHYAKENHFSFRSIIKFNFNVHTNTVMVTRTIHKKVKKTSYKSEVKSIFSIKLTFVF